MKKQTALFLGLIFSLSFTAFAQTKTVTNADLEKFRQQRVRAEREYRENYERMGFPSPEELERQRDEDQIRREELSAKLKAERLQREAIEAQNRQNEALRRQNQYLQNIALQNYSGGGYYYGGYGYYPYGYTNYSGGFGNFNNTRRYRGAGFRNPNAFPNGRFVPVSQPYLPLSIRNTFPRRFGNQGVRFRYNNPNVKIRIGGGIRR